jgi:exonuclease SbcC
VLQERINALKPLLDTLPAAIPKRPNRLFLITGARSTTNACRCKASLRAAAAGRAGKERLQQSQTQFAAALAASCFADQEAFLAALLDDDTSPP